MQVLAELLLELRRGQVLQAAVRADLVVVQSPGLDDRDGLLARTEPFDGQALVSELSVEALVGAVLPGLARIVEHGGDTGAGDPFQDGLADELGAVVRTHEQRCPVNTDQAREQLDHALGANRAIFLEINVSEKPGRSDT